MKEDENYKQSRDNQKYLKDNIDLEKNTYWKKTIFFTTGGFLTINIVLIAYCIYYLVYEKELSVLPLFLTLFNLLYLFSMDKVYEHKWDPKLKKLVGGWPLYLKLISSLTLILLVLAMITNKGKGMAM